MTGSQSTPEPAIDETAFDQKQLEYARSSGDIRSANKAVLFDVLAAAGIETVTVIFDGYGDSGQIERIDVEPGQGTVLLPSDRIEIVRTIDVAERTIKLDYNERYTSSEHYSHEF